ncbi:MAG: patatin-like phospholipase family protein [Thermoanaerobaculia bacterium]
MARGRWGPIVAWVMFVRFQMLVGLLLLSFPFIATGPLSWIVGNLFVLAPLELFAVVLLALLTGKALVLATNTASCSGPLRLLPGANVREAGEGRELAERADTAFALAWNPDGPVARALGRWDERIAVGLALPTIAVAYIASARAGASANGWLFLLLAVASAALVYAAMRSVTNLLEKWFENPLQELPEAASGTLARLERRAQRSAPPAIARASRRMAVRFLLLPSFRAGYVRERSADEALGEYSRRREAGDSEQKLQRVDDPTLRFDLLRGHGAALAFFTFIFLGYLVLGLANYPGWVEPWCPTLGYVLVLFMGIGWGLAALSFWLDRFRVSVVVLFLLTSVLTASLGGSDHFFPLIAASRETSGASEGGAVSSVTSVSEAGGRGLSRADCAGTPAVASATGPGLSPDEQALVDRIRTDCGQPIVVVAAAGGGITAAAWTAAMLTRLAERSEGGKFVDALRIVSGVSGGSVGLMYFLDGVPERNVADVMTSDQGARIRSAAATSSLDSVGWGLAYPDLARAWFSPLVSFLAPMVDRSWALQRSWEVRLDELRRQRGAKPGEAPTLRSWRKATLAGRLPAVIFNATTVESGERFEMSSIALTGGGGRSDFREAFPEYDLSVSAAARLSATFPFVSVAARGRSAHGVADLKAHFVDGGYYDNSGLLSALELLDRLLGELHESGTCAPPVALVRLEPFRSVAGSLAKVAPESGWKSALISPVAALLKVNTATQEFRNNWEAGIFQQKWQARGATIQQFRFAFPGAGPLSWKLTPAEAEEIDHAAASEAQCPSVKELFWFLAGQPSARPPVSTAVADAAARSELGPGRN